MRCPHCGTENREDRVACYHCGKDLTLLRLIHNKAKAHFNAALEHVEQLEYYEALGDLNAALELDSRFAEALVLRGTILARLDRSHEARESLDAALALNPQAIRAHRYIEALNLVRPQEPLLKRLRLLLGGAVAIVALALVVTFLVLYTGGEGEQTRLARSGWEALQLGDFAESRRLAMELSPEGEQNELLSAIDIAVQNRLDIAARHAQAQQYREALAVLQELDDLTLPEDLARSLDRERERVREGYIGTILGQYEDAIETAAETGALPEGRLAALRRREEEFLRLFPDSEERLAEVRAETDARIESRLEEALARADAALEQDGEHAEASSALRMASLWARFIDREEGVRQRLERLNTLQAERLFARAQAAAREGDREAYDSAIASLRALPLPAEDALARASALRSIFIEREQAGLTATLRAALAEGAWRHALQVAESIEAIGGTMDPQLTDSVERARASLALQSYYDLMRQAAHLESGELTREEAEEVLALVEEARGPMPPRLADRADESLHFFSAIALRALQQEEQAQGEIARLRENYPESAYLFLWQRAGNPPQNDES